MASERARDNPAAWLRSTPLVVQLVQTSTFGDVSALLSRLSGNFRELDLTFAVTILADRAEVSYRFANQYGGESTQTWFPPREYILGFGYKS
jgi:hypothetical protein